MTQPPDQQPTQHAPQGPPPGPPSGGGQQQPPPPQQWPVAPPPNPNPYGGGSSAGAGAGGYSGYPQQGYPQAGYPQGGYPQQPQGGGSGKAIAIIIGSIILVAVLFCGGIIAAIAILVRNAEDAFDDWDPERTGGRDNPITVEVGEAFEIDGIEYAEGWALQPPADEYGGDTITGLKATNDRDDESSEWASLYFTFVDAENNEVGQITCTADGSIAYGNSEELDCSGYEKLTAPYDHIEVYAS